MIKLIILSKVLPFPALFESFICFLVQTRLSSCSFHLFIHAQFTHPSSQIFPPICSTLNYHPLVIFSPTCLFLKAVFCLASPSVFLGAFILLSCLHLLHSSEELGPELVSFMHWNTSKQVPIEEN